MQFGFVALLDPDLADVVGALVIVGVETGIVMIGIAVVLFADGIDLFLIALRDPADIADHVGSRAAERILAEQPGAHVDAGEAETLRRETCDFLVGQPRADRQAFEVLGILEQLFEAAAVALIDRDDRRELIDDLIERRVQLGRRDFERIGRVIAGEHHAVAIGDDAAIGHDRRHRNSVFLGFERILAVVPDLQEQKAQDQKPEADEHEQARRRDAEAELRKLLLGVFEFRHACAPAALRNASSNEPLWTLKWAAYRPDRPDGAAASAAASR